MRELHLFAGLGGGILGGMLLGHTPVCAVEIDKYCQQVLRQRQADGLLPADMAIHDDVTTFDGNPWRGKVDIVCGGFPCQDLSLAGKREGLHGKRSGLFFQLVRIVQEIQPEWVFIENVPNLLNKGFGRVLREMAEVGYDAAWTVLSDSVCGSIKLRKRLWILCRKVDVSSGYGRHGSQDSQSDCQGDDGDQARSYKPEQSQGSGVLGEDIRRDKTETLADTHLRHVDADKTLCTGGNPVESGSSDLAYPEQSGRERGICGRADQEREGLSGHAGCGSAMGGTTFVNPWAVEPDVGRVVNGVPDRVGRLRGLGNAQVPVVAATAYRLLERTLRGE